MNTQGKKAKGRALQDAVAKAVREYYEFQLDDAKGITMGRAGVDIQLSPHAREIFPFSIECKSRSQGFTPVYEALEQSQNNKYEDTIGIAVVKQNRKKPVVVMYLDDWLDCIK